MRLLNTKIQKRIVQLGWECNCVCKRSRKHQSRLALRFHRRDEYNPREIVNRISVITRPVMSTHEHLQRVFSKKSFGDTIRNLIQILNG